MSRRIRPSRKSKAAGKVATKPGAAGQVGLDINDYLKPGDRLTVIWITKQ
jgi:hypothetical protein